MIETNKIYCMDCLEGMKQMEAKSVDLILTDIPYGVVNRDSKSLRTLRKVSSLNRGNADRVTFELIDFLEPCARVCKGTIIIFCGKEQLSQIHSFFNEYQKKGLGTVRQLIWKKTNPSPMNGQHIYLSGIENAVWFKFRGSTYNAFCKNTVFEHSCGRSKLHPTEKNHALLKELLQDNSNEGDIVFDPCCGSGSHLLVGLQNNRKVIGFEISPDYCGIAIQRIKKAQNQTKLRF